MTRTATGPAAGATAADDRVVRVVAVPADHPYVRRVGASVELLPDPPVPGAPAGQWWPPAALDPAWIRAHAADADVLHIHFGMESFDIGHMTACLKAAQEAGWATVFTAHDLSNPQLSDQRHHVAQLDEVFSAVDAVIALTPGAADEIARRWGREATVIPHPTMHDVESALPRVFVSGAVRIATHLKDLRPSVDGPGTVKTLFAAVDALRAEGVPAVAEVRMHHRVRDEQARAEVRRLCALNEDAALIEHDRLSDAELVVALSRLDACVLPYRHGTQSGWLELCWDLGVAVAVPPVGFIAQQHSDDSVAVFTRGDSGSLAAALSGMLSAPEATRPGSAARDALVQARRRQRAEADAAIADDHRALYLRVLAERDG